MSRLKGGARSACEIGGTPPISALTNGSSIGSGQRPAAAGFGPKSSTSSRVTRVHDPSYEPAIRSLKEGVAKRSAIDTKSSVKGEKNAENQRQAAEKNGGIGLYWEHHFQAGAVMRLNPDQPPGPITRKARDYAAEIAELRLQGYTLDAIRRALAAAGVEVSISTVWREATRPSKRNRPQTQVASHPLQKGADSGRLLDTPEFPISATAPAPHAPRPSMPGPMTGKEVAEEFRRSQCTNPFIRAKEQR